MCHGSCWDSTWRAGSSIAVNFPSAIKYFWSGIDKVPSHYRELLWLTGRIEEPLNFTRSCLTDANFYASVQVTSMRLTTASYAWMWPWKWRKKTRARTYSSLSIKSYSTSKVRSPPPLHMSQTCVTSRSVLSTDIRYAYWLANWHCKLIRWLCACYYNSVIL